MEKKAKEQPDYAPTQRSLALVYAGLGWKDRSIQEAKLAVQMRPGSQDAGAGPEFIENLALVYALTGEYDAALDQIDYLLSIPSNFSVPLLQLDPRFDPLRKLPRYQELLKKHPRL